MRSKSNLKEIGHVTKTREEREKYMDQFLPTDKEVLADDFDDTLSGGAENKPKKTLPPYSSFVTIIIDNWKPIAGSLLPLIVLPAVYWVITSLIKNDKDIAVLNSQYNFINSDVKDMSAKYSGMNEKTIKTEVLLGEIQKDLENLERQITGSIKNSTKTQ